MISTCDISWKQDVYPNRALYHDYQYHLNNKNQTILRLKNTNQNIFTVEEKIEHHEPQFEKEEDQ